jgi:hypothetical protein
MNWLIEYFDLGSKLRARGPLSRGKTLRIHWFPQYLALLVGILIQPLFQQYMAGKDPAWDAKQVGMWILASVVIAVMAFPGIYKASFDPEKSIFVQLCVILTSGTGWQTLVSGALKAAGTGHA